MQNRSPSDKQIKKVLFGQFNNLTNGNARKSDNDFERELNQRLNYIQQKQSSHRKFKAYENQSRNRNFTSNPTVTQQSNGSFSSNQALKLDRRLTQDLSNRKHQNQNQSLKQHNYINYDDISEDQDSHRNRYQLKNSRQNQQKWSKPRITIKQKLFEQQIVPQYRNILSNQSTIRLFDKYFQGYQQISVNQFVKALLIQAGERERMPQHQMTALVERMRKDLTTTDPQIVSLNALQILNKKTDLRSYVIEKLAQIRFNKKKKDLQVSYKELLQNHKQKQQQLQNRKQLVQNKQYELKNRQAQIYNKQKILREKEAKLMKKEKQLMDRDKNIKVFLKQKSQKIMEDHKKQMQKIMNNICSKSVSFQKNAKMRLQTIQRKLDDLKQLKLLQKNIANQKNNQNKNSNQQFINRIKKLQRDIQKNNQMYIQNLQKIQQQNKQFLKASSILQSKLQKIKQKLKRQKDENESKADLIKNLQFQVKQKSQMIAQLITNLRSNSQAIQASQQNGLFERQKMKQNQQLPKGIKHSRAKRNERSNKQSNQQEKESEKLKTVIGFYQHLLQIVFLNLNMEGRQKIQVILSRQVQQIVSMSVPVFLILFTKKIQAKFIPQFIVKTVAMVCGLYKHQQNNSLKQMLDSSEDYQNSSKTKPLTQASGSKVSILLQKIQKNNYTRIIQHFKQQKMNITHLLEYAANANVQNLPQDIRVDQQSLQLTNLCVYLSLFRPLQSNKQERHLSQILSISSLIKLTGFQLGSLLMGPNNNIDEIVNLLCYKFIQPISHLKTQNDSYLSAFQDALTIVDAFLQACRSEKFIKQLYSIQNYKILIKTMLKMLRCTQPNKKKLKVRSIIQGEQMRGQSIKQKLQIQICEKMTIILQRLVYIYNQEIQMSKQQINVIRDIVQQRQGNEKQQDKLLVANLKSIISGVEK